MKEIISNCDCGPGIVCGVCKPVLNLNKPGKKEKKQPKYSKIKIHKIERPEDRKCVNCGIYVGTECFHHPEDGTVKFLDGGGIVGGKVDGHLTAYLCAGLKCGVKFDTKPNKEAPEIEHLKHDNFTAKLVLKTWNLPEKK